MEGGGYGIFSDFLAAFALPGRLSSNMTQVRTEYIPSKGLGCLNFIRREGHSLDGMILAPDFWYGMYICFHGACTPSRQIKIYAIICLENFHAPRITWDT